MKKEYLKDDIVIGSVYEAESWANVNIHIRVTGFDRQGLGFFGDIARKIDLRLLKKAGVPFNPETDWPDDCETFVYYHQVVKKVRKKRKKRKKR